MLTYADVCRRMLTGHLNYSQVYCYILLYRMLMHADMC
jgi:hypothetical protein